MLSTTAVGLALALSLNCSASAQQNTRVSAIETTTAVAHFSKSTSLQPTAQFIDLPERGARAAPSRTAQAPCGGAQPMAIADARALVARVAMAENFFPDFVVSVAKAESQFNSTALSDKGAYGLMQLKPEIARQFQVKLCDPVDNIRGGVRFLRLLHDRYRNPLFILAAYNAGEDAVEKNHGVPPVAETVRFVAEVLNDFYAWPGSAAPPTRSAISAVPDVIEPASAPAAVKNFPADWSAEFVMHID